eukprot:SAG11_NODE_7103_length_1193_cov_1.266910_2_plen_209_part_00
MLVRARLPNSCVVSVRAEPTDPISTIRARIAAELGGGAEAAELGRSGRLVLGGRELSPHLTLAQCAGECRGINTGPRTSCADHRAGGFAGHEQSELLLQLRAPPPAARVDPYAELRAALANSQLRDFDEFQKVGGRDIAALGGAVAGYSQHGVCSYVYKARLRGGGGGNAGATVALKVRGGPPSGTSNASHRSALIRSLCVPRARRRR